MQIRCAVRIPLRDGVHLAATMYLPTGDSGPTPCVVTLTPYISDAHHDSGVYYATHGLAFVIVDVRGRGNSEGEFHPFLQEAADGHDVVEWLGRQAFCNGQVAMWGGSYLGYAQWATAKERPSRLATIVPTAAPYPGVDFPMRNNIVHPFVTQWLALVGGRASQKQLCSDQTLWAAVYRRWHESGRPFQELDAALGSPSPHFQEWLAHPASDEYWDAYNPSPDQLSRLEIPVLTITGIYDDDQPGALEHYRQHMRHASPEARARHYLIIGPWDHYGTSLPRAEFGGLRCGPASLLDLRKIHLDWYAWTLSKGAKPPFLEKPVAYYVMGAEQWRYANSLEEITARYRALFLHSDGSAGEVFCSGSLRIEQGEGGPDSYTYDPCDVHDPALHAEANVSGSSLVDQTVTLALNGRQLIYHSAPFEEDTEISGFFRLSAYISIDCPDTDLYVSVHEIGLDGESIRLSTDAVRARYREGLRVPQLICSREPLRYDFERFTFVSRLIERGHRLRLVIAPIGRLIEGVFTQKNYNAGGAVAAESSVDGRPVNVRLFHDRTRPSALYVPLGVG